MRLLHFILRGVNKAPGWRLIYRICRWPRVAAKRLYGTAVVVMHRDGIEVDVFHATQVDRRHRVTLGVGAFAIRVDAARRAEAMLDHVLVESVGADRAFRSLQAQLVARDEPQQRALAGTDGAIAGERAIDFAFNFEGDLAAMAASLVEHAMSPRDVMIVVWRLAGSMLIS